MSVWCFLICDLKKNFDIGFWSPDKCAPIYFLLITKISVRYFHYVKNKLVEYDDLLGR